MALPSMRDENLPQLTHEQLALADEIVREEEERTGARNLITHVQYILQRILQRKGDHSLEALRSQTLQRLRDVLNDANTTQSRLVVSGEVHDRNKGHITSSKKHRRRRV